MKLAYAIDHEQKIIEYDPEFEKILPDLNYKRVKISGTTQSLVFQKMFKLSVPSLPGDSGGAVYVTI